MNAQEKINAVSTLARLIGDYYVSIYNLSELLKTLSFLFKEDEPAKKYANEIARNENMISGTGVNSRALILLEKNSSAKLEKINELIRMISILGKSTSPLENIRADAGNPIDAYLKIYSSMNGITNKYSGYKAHRENLKKALYEAVSVLNSEKDYFRELTRSVPKKDIPYYNSKQRRFIQLFSIFLSKRKNILAVMDEIDRSLDEIRRDRSFIDAIREFRKNFSFNVNPGAINPALSGNIAVKVRMGLYHGEGINAKFIESLYANYIMPGEQRFGSMKAFCMEIEKTIVNVINLIVRDCAQLFIRVYGRRMNIEIFLDVNENQSGYASVLYQDETLRSMRISINSNYLCSVVEHNRFGSLEATLVHEINHLLDKNLSHSSSVIYRIRDEGIAMFSEYAYSRKEEIPHFLQNNYDHELMLKLMERPINSAQFIERIEQVRGSAPYKIGFFMCLVCYFALLRRRFGLKPNIRNLSEVVLTSEADEAREYAKIVLNQMRNVRVPDFGMLYMKYSQEIGVPLIFTPEFIRMNFV
ncbi:MAG: hypothetical protein NTV63_03810 [Candidatus Woesearchaeota archaeon]|nr:hypothetical protein [Candidatus Woesearchaeota archaeon]